MIANKKQQTANRRLAKVAVQCSADTFVVNQRLVLRINICGENRHLRQAPKRCQEASVIRYSRSFIVRCTIQQRPALYSFI